MDVQTLDRIHTALAWVVMILNGAAGAWALGAHWLAALRGRALWWFTGVAEVFVALQIVVGVVLVNRAGIPLPRFHAFYGFLGLIAIAIIYSYRIQMRHRLYLLYGFGGLFIMGLAIRAFILKPT